jgi:hypothetical protein
MSDDRIERYVSGQMSDVEREDFEREILERPDLAEEIYADAQVRSLIESAAEARAEERTREPLRARRPWWRLPTLRWAIPVAAAAVALVFLVRTADTPGPGVFRGVGAGLSALAPAGDVDAPPDRFSWTSYPGAYRYRFELFDATSTPVHTVVTADTTVSLSDAPVAAGYWTVTPLGPNLTSLHDAIVTRFRSTSN